MYSEKTAGSKSDSNVSDASVELKRKKKRSASTDSSTPKCKKMKSEKNKRKRRDVSSESSYSSDSSQTCSSSSSDERRKKQKKKKHKKEKKRKVKKEKKKKAKKRKKQIKEEELIGPVLPDNAGVKYSSVDAVPHNSNRSMAPMTKEEWEKRQSVVRRVFDEETGRYRLIKGDGEVLEEIVSRERHREINKQATLGDGMFFQAKLSSIHHK